MEYVYCGRVAGEPDTWVLGELKEVDDKYSVIYQKQEYPFAKCCGVGYFSVWTASLFRTNLIEDKDRGQDDRTLLQESICKATNL